MTYRLRNNRAEDLADGLTRVFGNCQFTGQEWECRVPTEGVHLFESGVPAQRAFPDLSAEVREFLISGTSPAGWKKAFG